MYDALDWKLVDCTFMGLEAIGAGFVGNCSDPFLVGLQAESEAFAL